MIELRIRLFGKELYFVLHTPEEDEDEILSCTGGSFELAEPECEDDVEDRFGFR